jgi:hypothetical protein
MLSTALLIEFIGLVGDLLPVCFPGEQETREG